MAAVRLLPIRTAFLVHPRLSCNESGNVSFPESPLKGRVWSNSYCGLVQVGPRISWTDNCTQSGWRCCYANCLLWIRL